MDIHRALKRWLAWLLVLALCAGLAPTVAADKVSDAKDKLDELQKEQGLDLGKYTGKTVTRYTYEIKNYEGYEGAVYANLIVYRNKIVGADLTGVGDVPFVKALTAREA